ncbi:MAG TPA: CocE/NonD family hydrolase, partial [Blastocatellia bacterium]|nr:CocE/NonD family hydrolase [Blastocatellia bacterium]
LPYRDSRDSQTGISPYTDWNPASYLKQVNDSKVAVFHLAGWYDLWPRDALVWFNNLKNPQRIVIGPWSHGQVSAADLASESLRWYDHWLKGVDNGIMDEPPILYYTMGAAVGDEWRTSWQWPLPNEEQTRFYFQKAEAGSIDSVNDGTLSASAPAMDDGAFDYTVDYTTTSGRTSRWANGYGGEFGYPDMSANDKKGLTYTTSPLSADLEITGHPVVNIWVSSTAKDGDFFAYLEEVDESEFSRYITEGTLRASDRAVSAPAYNYMGLPFHEGRQGATSGFEAGEPVALVFDMHPTSNVFNKGHKLRVTITCADRDNALTPELSPPPTIKIYMDSLHASYISLPVIPAEVGEKQKPALLPIVLVVLSLAVMATIVIRIKMRR